LPVDGGGSSAPKRASDLREHGYDVCLFADSDTCAEWNPSETTLAAAGIKVVIWDDKCCSEKRIIDDLPGAQALFGFVKAAKEGGISEQSILNALNDGLDTEKLADIGKIATYSDLSALKQAIYKASTSENKAWFKTVSRGETLGDFVFSTVFEQIENSDFHRKLKMLEGWALGRR